MGFAYEILLEVALEKWFESKLKQKSLAQHLIHHFQQISICPSKLLYRAIQYLQRKKIAIIISFQLNKLDSVEHHTNLDVLFIKS